MRADEQELRRLGSGGEPPSSLEARAGAFLREAYPLTGISDTQVDAIEKGLVHRTRRRRDLRLVPVLVVVAVLLVIGSVGSVMALVGGWRPRLPFLASAPTSQDSPPAHAQKTKVAVAALPDPLALPSAEIPVPEPRPQLAARRTSRVEPVVAPRAPLAEAPPVESRGELPTFARRGPSWGGMGTLPGSPYQSPLSAEARSLANALARWRRDGQGEVALALLLAHERRFPQGGLSVESRIARAEILLALDRRDQALAVFDSLTLTGLPRARELETLRGELRAHAGRCRDARSDLSHVVAGGGADDLSRRAARALAGCP